MKVFKRGLCVLLAGVMAFSTLASYEPEKKAKAAEEWIWAADLAESDIESDGGVVITDPNSTFNGEPIEWQVIGRDQDGYRTITLQSKKVLQAAAYDAKESGGATQAQESGSNDINSNLYQWLNSNSATPGGWYSPQNDYDQPPSKENILENPTGEGGSGAIYEQPGFLSYLSNDFCKNLREVTKGQDSTVHQTKMFCLAAYEIGEGTAVSNSSFDAFTYPYYKTNAKKKRIKTGANGEYWLRTPYTSSSNKTEVYWVKYDGAVASLGQPGYNSLGKTAAYNKAYNAYVGVAPACIINSDIKLIKTGNNTYTIDFSQKKEIKTLGDVPDGAIVFDKNTKWYDTQEPFYWQKIGQGVYQGEEGGDGGADHTILQSYYTASGNCPLGSRQLGNTEVTHMWSEEYSDALRFIKNGGLFYDFVNVSPFFLNQMYNVKKNGYKDYFSSASSVTADNKKKVAYHTGKLFILSTNEVGHDRAAKVDFGPTDNKIYSWFEDSRETNNQYTIGRPQRPTAKNYLSYAHVNLRTPYYGGAMYNEQIYAGGAAETRYSSEYGTGCASQGIAPACSLPNYLRVKEVDTPDLITQKVRTTTQFGGNLKDKGYKTYQIIPYNESANDTYNVVFNLNGGKVGDSPMFIKKSVQPGDQLSQITDENGVTTEESFPVPIRSGYEFDGWYDREIGGNKVEPGYSLENVPDGSFIYDENTKWADDDGVFYWRKIGKGIDDGVSTINDDGGDNNVVLQAHNGVEKLYANKNLSTTKDVVVHLWNSDNSDMYNFIADGGEFYDTVNVSDDFKSRMYDVRKSGYKDFYMYSASDYNQESILTGIEEPVVHTGKLFVLASYEAYATIPSPYKRRAYHPYSWYSSSFYKDLVMFKFSNGIPLHNLCSISSAASYEYCFKLGKFNKATNTCDNEWFRDSYRQNDKVSATDVNSVLCATASFVSKKPNTTKVLCAPACSLNKNIRAVEVETPDDLKVTAINNSVVSAKDNGFRTFKLTFDATVMTMPDHDVTLYAHWTKKNEPNTVTLSLGGGEVDGNTTDITRKTFSDDTYNHVVDEELNISTLSLPTPTKEGYRFDGWYTEGNDKITDESVMGEDITLHAKWTRKGKISFNANGGQLSESTKDVYENESYGELPVPVKAHHDFDGWFTPDGVKVNSSTVMGDEDVILYAHYSEKEYDITYEYTVKIDGEATSLTGVSNTNPTKYKVSDGEIILNEATKGGYDFKNWKVGGETITKIDSVIESPIVGEFCKKSYSLTFNYQNGNSVTRDIFKGSPYGKIVTSVEEGTEKTEVFPSVTKPGYTFKEWNTLPNGEGERVTESTVMGNNDTTIYAIWTRKGYNINYEYWAYIDGVKTDLTEVADTNPSVYTIEDDDIEFTYPQKDGYQVKEFKDEDTVVTGINVLDVSDKTISVQFIKKQHRLDIDYNGGKDSDNNESKSYMVFENSRYDKSVDDQERGLEEETSLPVITRDGYTFKEYNTKNDGTGDKVTNTTVMGDKDVNIYAIWELKGYNVTYAFKDKAGNSLNSVVNTNPTTYTVEGGDIILSNPVKTGYEFKEWKINDTTVTKIKADTMSSIAIEGVFERKYHSLTFKYQDGDESEYSVYEGCKYSTTIDETEKPKEKVLPTPKRTGFTFTEWNTDKNGNGVTVDENSLMGTTDTVVYAIWSENVYHITYLYKTNINGQETALNDVVNNNPTSYKVTDADFDLMDASKDGYSFNGWEKDNKEITTVKTSDITDITLVGTFTKAAHTLSFDYQGGKDGKDATSSNRTVFEGSGYGKAVEDKDGGIETNAEFPIVSKSYHTFKEWNTNADGSGDIVTPSTVMGNSDVTIFAQYTKWVPKTVTLKLNGGTVNESGEDIIRKVYENDTVDKVVDNDVITTNPLPTPEKNKYRFNGWFTESKQKVNDSTVVNSDITLLADYTYIGTLTFNANGGSVSVNTKEVLEGEEYGQLPTPEWEKHRFEGWYTDDGAKVSSTTKMSQSDVNLNAYWTYLGTLTFDAGEGEVDTTSKDLEENEFFGLLPTPFRQYHNFLGWFTDDGQKVDSETKMGNEDMTVFAHWDRWTPKTVTFNLAGGKVGELNIVTRKVYEGNFINQETDDEGNVTIVTLPEPTKAKHRFEGFYYNGNKVSDTTKVEDDVEVTAKWTFVGTLTFNPEGGEVTPNTKELAEGEVYGELPVPERDSHRFVGWFDEDDKEVTSQSKMGSQDVTVHAKWLHCGVLTFNAEGGEVTPNSKNLLEGESFGLLPTPVKKYHDFNGWFTADGVKVDKDTTMGSTDTTIYAQYTKWAPYKITYDTNQGSLGPEEGTYRNVYKGDTYNQTVDENEEIVIMNLPTPERTRYRFDGWYDSSGNSVSEDTVATKDDTIYAHWTRIGKITFDSNGGSLVTNVRDVYEGTEYGSLPEPLYDKHRFDGWYTQKIGGSAVSGNEVMGSEDVTLYAHWTYQGKLTFNPEGGTVEPSFKSLLEGESYGTLPTPKRKYYNFLGWYDKETDGDLVKDGVMDKEDVTLYAYWSDVVYKISYNTAIHKDNDKKFSASKVRFNNKQDFYTQKGSNLTTTVSYPGNQYVFAGWKLLNDSTTDQDDKGEISSPVKALSMNGRTGDKVLVPVFENPEPKKLTINFNGGTFDDGTAFVIKQVCYGQSFKTKNDKGKNIEDSLPVPKRKGYKFKGWSKAKN